MWETGTGCGGLKSVRLDRRGEEMRRRQQVFIGGGRSDFLVDESFSLKFHTPLFAYSRHEACLCKVQKVNKHDKK